MYRRYKKSKKTIGKTSVSTFENYHIVYQVAISPDKNWLAACDNKRIVNFFNIQSIATCSSGTIIRPSHTFELSNPSFALETVDKLLICGDASGFLIPFDWSAVQENIEEPSSPLYSINAFDGIQEGPRNINSILYNKYPNRLFVGGAGDNCIREYDVNCANKIISRYKGHTDSICVLKMLHSSVLYSSSQDGTIRIWDSRTAEECAMTDVAANEEVSRPSFGKSVSALAVHDDYFFAGGSMKFGFWDTRTMSLIKKLDCGSARHLTCEWSSTDKLTTGSCDNGVRTFTTADNGNKIGYRAVKPSSVYSMVHSEQASFYAGGGPLIEAVRQNEAQDSVFLSTTSLSLNSG